MLLNHPITNINMFAEVKQNTKGEYYKIIFKDGLIVNDESYIYDVLFESNIITKEEYNKQFWYSEKI